MTQTIGDRIASIIDELNLKKVEFARKLNIDQSYVTQLIKGRNNPSDRLVSDICEKFNVNEIWLRSGNSDMFVETDDSVLSALVKQYNLSSKQEKIISNFLKLSDSDRQAIANYFEGIAKDCFSADQQVLSEREEIHARLDAELDAEQKGLSVSQGTDLTIKRA